MNVLLMSSDTIDVKMAGPGIRYWEFARQLSRHHRVTVLTPNRSSLSHPNVTLIQRTPSTLSSALEQTDVVVTQGFAYPIAPLLMMEKPLVVDLSFPLTVELLEHHSHLPLQEAELSHQYCVERTKLLLMRGDFFLYSHEALRDYWLGMLTAVGRLRPRQYRQDVNADRLFGLVPFGFPEEPPLHTRPAFTGENAIFPRDNISPGTDTILLWGGGLWRWFDPCIVIRAMADVANIRRDIKVVFICGKRADSASRGVNVAYATDEAISLSQELGLFEQTVFFNTDWVPYSDRGSYFLETDIGISTHFTNLETRFSFRTRLLDYLWAGLPVITTDGDALSRLIEDEQLGIVVAPQDVRQLCDAIVRLATDRAFFEQCRKNIQRIRPQFTWDTVIHPLTDFCASPYRTSSLSRSAKIASLTRFHATTAGILLKHRGYKKVFEKITGKLFPK